MKKIFLVVVILIYGCNKRESTDNSFFDKIDINKWNESSKAFLVKECNDSIYDRINKDYMLISKDRDTVLGFNNQIDQCFKNRKLFLDEIQKHNLFKKPIDTLIIIENYIDFYDLKTNYLISSNGIENSFNFYLNSNKIQTINSKEEYNDVIKKVDTCVYRVKNYVNDVRFETVIYKKSHEIYFETKSVYLGSIKSER